MTVFSPEGLLNEFKRIKTTRDAGGKEDFYYVALHIETRTKHPRVIGFYGRTTFLERLAAWNATLPGVWQYYEVTPGVLHPESEFVRNDNPYPQGG